MKRFLPSAAFFLLILFIALSARPLQNSDIFTDLASGRYIIEEIFPKTNPFTLLQHGGRWVIHSWLFGVLNYFLYVLGGFRLLFFLKIILYSVLFLTVYFYLTKLCRNFIALIISMAYFFIFTLFDAALTPYLFSYIFTGIILILCGKTGWKRLLLIFAVFLLWVNIHAGFLIGLLIFLIFYGAAFKKKIIYFILLLLTCLLNPNGYEIFNYSLRYIFSFPVFSGVSFFSDRAYILAAAAVYYFVSLYFKRLTKKTSALTLLFLLISVYSKRFAPVFGWVIIKDFFLTADFITHKYLFLYNLKNRCAVGCFLKIKEIAFLFFITAVLGITIQPLRYSEFPFDSARELKRIKAQGTILTYCDWGSFLTFEFPAVRPLIDCRGYFFTPASEEIFKSAVDDFDSDILNRYNIEYALLRQDHKNLGKILLKFDIIYQTYDSEILMRRKPLDE